MTNPIISVENLGKRYTIRHQSGRPAGGYRRLSEELVTVAKKPFRAFAARFGSNRRDPSGSTSTEDFWALRNVSVDVTQGEVLGIIGRNGAGKSTLLKILSRITEPTEGRVTMRGRIASLLEVGTGFHPELTGRENVFLNGTILGMSREEIKKRFDEIVAFAEVDRFLDTPVKRYSSGMYVRLAFAVAAHLEPEILVVDEVLAVGDAVFQRKCLGKMGEVADGGRTVLFVSHNMEAVDRLCHRAIWLKDGIVSYSGKTQDCIQEYLNEKLTSEGVHSLDPPLALENEMPVWIYRVETLNANGKHVGVFGRGESISIRITWEAKSRLYKPRIGFVLQTPDGQDVMTSFDASSWRRGLWLEAGTYESKCHLPGGLLNEGDYVLDFGGDSPRGTSPKGVFGFRKSRTGPLIGFEIVDRKSHNSKHYGEDGVSDGRWPGSMFLDLEWTQREFDRQSTTDR